MASITAEFFDHFPDDILRDFYDELLGSYDGAPLPGAGVGLGPDHNRWLWPLCRRAMFEQRLLELVNKKGGHVTAHTEFASKDNTPYTVVESGPFFLTVSHLDKKGPLPPEAKFRQANSSLNYGLFADLYEAGDQPRYAILTHRSTHDGRRLKSANIVFPDSNYKGIITRIDLVARYTAVTVAAPTAPPVATPVERIEDEAVPVLKKKSGQKRKAE